MPQYGQNITTPKSAWVQDVFSHTSCAEILALFFVAKSAA
jgi:hypothetical protein